MTHQEIHRHLRTLLDPTSSQDQRIVAAHHLASLTEHDLRGFDPVDLRPRPPKRRRGSSAPLAPVYGHDFRRLVNADFAPFAELRSGDPSGGPLEERIRRDAALLGRPRLRIDADGPLSPMVARDFLCAMMGEVSNPVIAFLTLAGWKDRLGDDELRWIDATLADLYWNRLDGLLTPPAVCSLLRSAALGESGRVLLAFVERARERLLARHVPLEVARARRPALRVEALDLGACGSLSEHACATAEFLVDYLLLQRGAMEDVLRAEAPPFTARASRASRLLRAEGHGRLAFEEVLPDVIRSQPIRDAIPASLRLRAVGFAERRAPHYRIGLLAPHAR